jgi:uncharacterized protein with HEPN domain
VNEDLFFLKDICDRIGQIEIYTQAGKSEFLESRLIQDGVMRNFELIGEGVKRLSSSLRQTYPAIPWRKIAGFRDVLIHDYLQIDLDEVWDVIERNLPELKHKILEILQEIDPDISI